MPASPPSRPMDLEARPPQVPRGRRAAPPAFQFGLGTLLAVMFAAAVTCSLFISMPAAMAAPALVAMSLGLPAVLTVLLAFGRGYQRAFGIGAIFPAYLPQDEAAQVVHKGLAET